MPIIMPSPRTDIEQENKIGDLVDNAKSENRN